MAEVRPIDANALMEQLRRKLKGTKRFAYLSNREQGWDEAIKSVMSMVHDQRSTLDYAPVRHSEWVQAGGFTVCKECGCSPADWEAKPDNPSGHPPYCHSCGAKMDGGAAQ